MTATPETPAEAWRSFLERFPETDAVDLILPDLAGIGRGKRLSADAFGRGLEGGHSFPSSLYGLDATGANVGASGLVWQEGDADRPCAIDPGTFAPVPWHAGRAQVLAGLSDHDHQPFFADPRTVLTRAAARFEDLGLRPVCALELEFYLLDRRAERTGRPRLARSSNGGPATSEGQVYSLDRLDEQHTFLDRLAGFCALQDLPASSAIAEYASGQFEINLGHVEPPLRAANHAFLLKRAVRAAAAAEGVLATFMAKPFIDRAANGLHVHLSLVDRHGVNQLAADDALLGHAIAGLQTTMAEGMLFFAPNANSYRRLRPRSYAPLAPSWGHNNRTVALRIPMGPPAARRIEHRVAGADANPYLVLAAVLAGVHHGLNEKLEPGAPTEGNAYDQVEQNLPSRWDRAIDALATAAILPDYLGADFCRLYRVCREAERDRFDDVITPTEYAWYLRTL